MTLDSVTSFSRTKKLTSTHVSASITVEGFGGISFRVMAENWQHLKDLHAFFYRFCVVGSK